MPNYERFTDHQRVFINELYSNVYFAAASIVAKLTPAETMHNCRTFSPSPPMVVRIPSLAVTQSLTGRLKIYDSKYNFTESNSSICSIAITLSGDIQANPGPTKFLCRICQRPMAKSHRDMDCDECERWIHIKCCSIDPKQYVKYQSETNCTWLCPTCSLPNFTDIASSRMKVCQRTTHLTVLARQVKVKKKIPCCHHYTDTGGGPETSH